MFFSLASFGRSIEHYLILRSFVPITRFGSQLKKKKGVYFSKTKTVYDLYRELLLLYRGSPSSYTLVILLNPWFPSPDNFYWGLLVCQRS